MTDHDHTLSREEAQALAEAARRGGLTAQLYRNGVFSEPDFILLGVLQRLAIRGRMAFNGLGEDRRDAAYIYTLAGEPVQAPAELTRNAA